MKLFSLLNLLFWGFGITLNAQLCADQDRFLVEKFDVEITKNIMYGKAKTYDGKMLDLKVDIYQPKEDKEQNRPCVLLAHGGSFIGGGKDQSDVVPLSQALAKRGYVVFTMSYRLGVDFVKILGSSDPEFKKGELLKAALRARQDGLAAIRFLKKSGATGNPYSIDTNKIIFAGVSAGAFIALHSQYLNTTEEVAMMYDIKGLDDIEGLDGNSGNPGYSTNVLGVVNLCGALGKASWVDQNEPQLISMHGTKDGVVPYAYGSAGVIGVAELPVEGSFLIDSVAKAKGVKSDLYTWIDGDHVPFVKENNPSTYQKYFDEMIEYVIPNIYNWVCKTTSIESKNIRITEEIKIFPNPSNGKINITELEANSQISVFNISGQKVYNTLTLSKEQIIDLETLPKGIYFVQILHSNQSYFKKVVIE